MNKKQRLEIAELYKIMPTSEIAKMYGVTGACIRWNLKKSGVKILPKGNRLRLPSDEIIAIYDSGVNCRDISLKYGCTPLEISRVLRRNGRSGRPPEISHRTTSINDNCFDEITEESAYWIGFLMADGSNLDNKGVSLGLSEIDLPHLEKFKRFLGSTRKISHMTFKNKLGNTQSAVNISVSSRRISSKLKTYGVVPRKTGREIVSDSLKNNRHFWRGMIDGDGNIGLNNSKVMVLLQFCGSEMIVQQFCDFVKSLFPNSNMSPHKFKHANCYRCSTSYKRAINIIKILYSDCSIYLDRKKELADKILTIELPQDRTRK